MSVAEVFRAITSGRILQALTAGPAATLNAISQLLVPTYALQTDWYVDGTSGNDAHAGTIGAPLKTVAEWARRMRGQSIDVAMTVHVVTSTTETDTAPNQIAIGVAGTLTFVGTSTSLATGTITSLVACNPATNTPDQITDSSKANAFWSAFVSTTQALGTGIRGRITSGAASGAIFWPAKDLGAKNARISAPVLPDYTGNVFGTSLKALATTEGYTVEQLPSCTGLLLEFAVATSNAAIQAGLAAVIFRDLWLPNASVSLVEATGGAVDGSAFYGQTTLEFIACDIANTTTQNTDIYINCRGCEFILESFYSIVQGGLCSVGRIEVHPSVTLLNIDYRVMSQSANANDSNPRSGAVDVLGPANYIASLQIYDSAQEGLIIRADTHFEQGNTGACEIFGSGNAYVGMLVAKEGHGVVVAGVGTTALTGVGGDIGVGFNNASAVNASALCSWSNVNFQALTPVIGGVTVAWSSTTHLDLSQGSRYFLTLGGATTTLTASNLRRGRFVFFFKQDATGLRTIGGYPASFDFGVVGAPVLSTGANKLDIFDCECDGTTIFVLRVTLGF